MNASLNIARTRARRGRRATAQINSGSVQTFLPAFGFRPFVSMVLLHRKNEKRKSQETKADSMEFRRQQGRVFHRLDRGL